MPPNHTTFFFLVSAYFRLKYECDLVVNLKHEEEKLNAVLEREQKDIKRLMDIITMIDR